MKDGDLYVTIKTDEEDFMAFQSLVPDRLAKIAAAPDVQTTPDFPAVNLLAARLHPNVQHLRVESVRQETPVMKLIRLVPEAPTAELAFFRAGQYVTFDLDIGGSRITRPYSISSSPKDSLRGYYEIGVKHDADGFAAKHFYETVKKGDRLDCSGPGGFFYYEDLRDRKNVVGIAGGAGITPFRSMARAIADGTIDPSLTLFYGANTEEELAFREEFAEIEKKTGGKFRAIYVLANEKKEGFERGYITAELLQRHVNLRESSVFVCGPQAMYRFIEREFEPLGLRRKLVRYELFGQPADIAREPDFPKEKIGKTFKVTVHQGPLTKVIDAASEETLVCSMERAGIRAPTLCRGGQCGFCRSQLVKGEVYVAKRDDGRRYGDVKLGFIHPCSTFPLSDCEIIVPPTKQ